MRLLRIIGKVLAFPVMLVVTAIQWLFVFLISFSSIIFYLLAGLFLLVAVLSLIFRVATWPEALRAGLAGFIVFMIPVIGEGITAIIAVFREELSDFIRS
ncbi:MAG: hypothetical protein IJ252_00315 [Solobacterium sp.]|nr:hypothetical protein [Solobacterium sp.]